MAIELHIQIDLEREPENIAAILNTKSANNTEQMLLIAEIEKIKTILVDELLRTTNNNFEYEDDDENKY